MLSHPDPGATVVLILVKRPSADQTTTGATEPERFSRYQLCPHGWYSFCISPLLLPGHDGEVPRDL